MAQFLLSCESTVDVPFAYMHSRGIPVIFYSYIIDEQPYPDDMGRDPEALPRFYAFLDAGKLPSTSQINQFAYYDYFGTARAGRRRAAHSFRLRHDAVGEPGI